MRRSAKVAVAGVTVAAVGWGLWEIAKWGIAVVSAPETAGLSLVVAAGLP
jgi:hypothetical protein